MLAWILNLGFAATASTETVGKPVAKVQVYLAVDSKVDMKPAVEAKKVK